MFDQLIIIHSIQNTILLCLTYVLLKLENRRVLKDAKTISVKQYKII